MNRKIPEFAIVGHPNEGKSSVVSTLSEDDRVRISPTPGETTECRRFPVLIDGREIICFTDTPGFQNPRKTLMWMKDYTGSDREILKDFCRNHKNDPGFRGEWELFSPIIQGAGIIYVIDGSRPLRKVDRAEMEILRLTGRPRMAIINCKDNEGRYLEQWKNEFRKHFNSVRVFNAHKATYAERITLLESLKSIDQDWEPTIEKVISAFKEDWEYRSSLVIEIVYQMLLDCLGYSLVKNYNDKSNEEEVKEKLWEEYKRTVKKIELTSHEKIRKLYKHNIYNFELPAQSILYEDLFNKKTWHFLGLKPAQLIIAAGITGGTIGAAIDMAAAGLTFGIFSAIGGTAAAGWAALGGGKKLSKAKVGKLDLGGNQFKIGPNENVQFLYILLDRALIFYSQIINWAHGRRDNPMGNDHHKETAKRGFTSEWNSREKKMCNGFLNSIRSGTDAKTEILGREMKKKIEHMLHKISHSEEKYGML